MRTLRRSAISMAIWAVFAAGLAGCPPTMVAVPDIVGMERSAAESAITSAGLTVGVVTEAYSDTVPADEVIEQNPAAGASVEPDSAVDLTVSKGPQPVAVPDLAGMTQGEVELSLTAVGLSLGIVTEEFNGNVPIGQVIRQAPLPNTMALPGSAVDIVLSKGPEPVVVPNVEGLTQTNAGAALGAAGLVPGAVTEQYDSVVPAGTVIAQDPSAGSLLEPGSSVALVVSKGPAPVTVPSVSGMTQTDAEQALVAAGLAVGTVTEEYNESVPEGGVISQEPVEDAMVAPGTLVDLVVSKGPEPIAVPDTVGMTQEEAEAALESARLSTGQILLQYSDDIPVDTVISQVPAAGTMVPPGAPVTLVISLGPEKIGVPDLSGLSEEAASDTLTNAGLTLGEVTYVIDESVTSDTVLSQEPAANTSVLPGTAVDIVVSQYVVVPDVRGVAEAEAIEALELAGLVVSSVQDVLDATVEEGAAIGSTPEAGLAVEPGTEVSLRIAYSSETIMLPGDVPLEMVWIEPGTFLMGIYEGERDSMWIEGPQHSVTLTKGFWLARYELTQAQWEAVMGTRPWEGQPVHVGDDGVLIDPNSPAVYVSWNDAQAFMAALNGLEWRAFRLPTEAEWEYACRAGTTTRFYWGDDGSYTVGLDYAWWRENTRDIGDSYAHLVGQKLPNSWGLYDMSGNVFEMCSDFWVEGYPEGSVIDPRGPETGTDRVLRGGSWLGSGRYARSASRGSRISQTAKNDFIGFRVARSYPEPAPMDSISVVSPFAGNEYETGSEWEAGTTHAIEWFFTGDIGDNVGVDLYLNGAFVGVIAQATPSDLGRSSGSFDWAIPLDQEPSDAYSVRVVSLADGEVYGESGVFTITAPEMVSETIMLPGNVPLEMMWIPSGNFMMGRYPGEQDGHATEDPQHEVSVTGFWLGKYEVTKRQWQAVMGTTPWSSDGDVLDDPDSPAVWVSWDDAQSFILALRLYSGLDFRLPSEAEWEYACRAGTTTRFYWGDDLDYAEGGAYAWWRENTRDLDEWYAHVVGQKLPNAWGLYDMSGNVAELCQDWYHPDYVGAPTDGSAWESPMGSNRVYRGGSWGAYDLHGSRSAYRFYSAPSNTATTIGFRVAR